MQTFKRLASRRALFVLVFGGLTAAAAGAGTLHRYAVSQSTGSGSLGSTAFLNTSSSGGAVQAQVGGSTLTSFTYPFGLFGIYNSSGIGFGTVGLSTTSYGVAGQSTSKYASVFGLSGGDGAAVEGMNPDTSSTAAPAGYFSAAGGTGIVASSTNGTAIAASSNGASGVAVTTSNTQPNSDGLFAYGGTTDGDCGDYIGAGLAVCGEGQNVGGAFIGEGPSGVGVGGENIICDNTSSQIRNSSLSGRSRQVSQPACSANGLSTTAGDAGAGVAGMGVSGPGVYGFSYFDYGVYAQNSSTSPTLEVENETGTKTNPAIEVDDDATGAQTLVEANGTLYTSGSVTSGTDTFNAVSRNPGTDVMTYSTQQAEATVEDVGTARLVNGSAVVPLAADFRQTMNESAPYMVIVTPYGESRGLYVASRTAAGFVVHENASGRSTLQFDYRVVAQPYGSPHARLPHLRDVVALPARTMRHTATANGRLWRGTVPRFGSNSVSTASTASRTGTSHQPLYNAPPVPANMFKLSSLHSLKTP